MKWTSPILVLVFVFCSVLKGQDKRLDSLKQIIDFHKNDTNYVNALLTYASLIRNTDISTASKYSDEALTLATKLKFEKGIAIAYLNMGTMNHLKGNLDSALIFYRQALERFNKTGLKSNACKCYNNMGYLYQIKGEYAKAIEHLVLCKKLAESIGEKKRVSDADLNIGNVYLLKKEYNTAIKQYRSSIKVAAEISDLYSQAQAFNNIGAAYRYLNNNDSALYNYKIARAIRAKMNDNVANAESVINIGDIFFSLGKYDSALVYFNSSYHLYAALGHKTGLAYSLNNLGSTLFKLKKNKAALDTLIQAINAAELIGARDLKLEAYKNMADLYFQTGEYKKSAETMDKMAALKDSLLNENNNKQIAEMQAKYESEKKDLELLKKNAEIKSKELEAGKESLIKKGLIAGLGLLVLVIFLVFRSFMQKKRDNIIISAQKEEVEQKNHIIEEKQKEIVDSINYAKKIQYTLLAHAEFMEQHLGQHFTLFKPKDIVSGDFYWATKQGTKFFLAVCDSTGHGVPGAFMSLLNIGFLSEAINEKNIFKPNEILEHTRQRLTETISKDGQKDGFDGILISINTSTKIIEYAAANNAPVLVSSNNLIELEADKMPVGVGERKEKFKLHTLDYKSGDMLFLYTDGYADQFGGPKGKKFKYKQLNELLVKISSLPVTNQHVQLSDAFDAWKGDLEQVDDVCVIGIRL